MVGELWIGGASLALGYYENRQLTGERFQSLPWAKEERIYATGDLALWSEQGEIVLVGRTDDQVKIRGNRVELGEVSFLLERCEAVSQASVLATEDATGQAMLAAFIVLSPGTQLETIISWSKGNLPTYMIPSFWHQLSTMPVTVTGKIDRDALKNIVKKKPLSKLDTQKIDSKLLSLCELVLGKKYDPETDFFVQGGDSLKAMSLLHEIRNKYTVDIPFRDLDRKSVV